ncbi:amidohydrolase family protein [Shewanella olleyana]|uniref:metal-dependent hydrolase family protein n=1 Tax=Shewanella olleyana TaxID=135626 RepID=UPI00200CEA28|nr:amidohydrolase family protein [Shewanella olleyana]MCL1065778.1 amidohydrolase family protein [Shewanella olleyana]
MKNLRYLIYSTLAISAFSFCANADNHTLITNANIFDGQSDTLIEGKSVLITDDKITKIAANITAPEGATVINANGRTLTPGLIAVHEHLIGQMPFGDIFNEDTRYSAYVATQTANTYLMNGFTTVRDVAGNTFSLKKAIDRGYITGPRIFPSGAMISQTSGHSDHRHHSDGSALLDSGTWDPMVRNGDMVVIDGVPEMLKAVREQLRMGASQIKIAVGGGTGSYADPLDVVEFTPAEIQAATQAASDWGTYVLAHVYNSDGIRRAIDNGVKVIEHANLIDKDTFLYMKKKDIWLSPQVIVFTFIPKGYTEDQANKHRQAYAGIDNMFKMAKEIGFKNIAFGSDIITDPATLARINEEFKFRAKWFEPYEIMQQATSNSAKLLSLSGKRSPYPAKLGSIEEGAYADILLIDGNPLKDIEVMTKPKENFDLIMKGGEVFKNTL